MTPEGRVKAIVKKRLKDLSKQGHLVYSFWPVLNGMGAPTLDCIACINGRFVAIETKAKGKNLTPRQEQTAKNVRDGGGTVIVVRDWDDLEYGLELLLKRTKGLLSQLTKEQQEAVFSYDGPVVSGSNTDWPKAKRHR